MNMIDQVSASGSCSGTMPSEIHLLTQAELSQYLHKRGIEQAVIDTLAEKEVHTACYLCGPSVR